MTPVAFSWLFVAFLVGTVAIRIWLSARQVRHVALNRTQVPAAFADKVGLDAHQKAADYTVAKHGLGLIDLAWSSCLLLVFTLLGGLQLIIELVQAWLPQPGLGREVLIVAVFSLLATLIDLPLEWYRQFRLEEKFGFNRMTLGLFFSDQIKGLALGALIGLPLLAAIIWLMQNLNQWWIWASLLWISFSLFMMILGPSLIMPLFNKFEPLPEGDLKNRLQALLNRCQFEAGGLFVMDGSKRSSHGNAFFAGMGKGRRIVLFDTIVKQLNGAELEAVLAHELGHFKLKHIVKRIVPSLIMIVPMFWLLHWLTTQTWFYQGLGVTVPLTGQEHQAAAIVLFMLALPVFAFILTPLGGLFSRKHEFEADHFAVQHSSGESLINALVKLYNDNASTLTPDPLYSAFYDSHPPASVRIGRLNQLINQ